MDDPRPAALWLGALQRLAERGAHEVNNALNGVVVNLEVVRARATPGADAGRVAPFAAAAIEQGDEAIALVGALVALSRPSRVPAAGGGTDLAAVARHVVALLAPAVAHRGVAIDLEIVDPGPAGGDPRAVRAAVALALLAAADAAESAVKAAPPVELGGADRAGDLSPRVRGIVGPGPALSVQLVPPEAIPFPPDVAATLRDAGVGIDPHGGAISITFRAVGDGA